MPRTDADGYINVDVNFDSKDAEKELKNFKTKSESVADGISENFDEAGDDIGKSMEEAADKGSGSMSKLDKKSAGHAGAIAGVFAAVTTKIINFFAEVAKQAAQALKQAVKESISLVSSFDDGLRKIQVEMGLTGKEGEETSKRLADAARQVGKETKFSAVEATEALAILTSAGYDAAQAIEMLPLVTRLATAGNMNLVESVEFLRNSMGNLRIAEADVESYIDKMAITAQKSDASIRGLGESFNEVGLLAANANQDVDKLMTTFGLMANANIKGAEAGSVMQRLILSLQSMSDASQKSLDGLGVSIYNADGSMRDVLDIMVDLNSATKDMSDQAKADIFGQLFSRREMEAVQAMMSQIDKGALSLFDDITNNSEGAAQAIADTLEGGIGGFLRSMKNLSQDMLLTLGTAIQPFLDTIFPLIKDLMVDIGKGLEEFFGAFSEENMSTAKETLTLLVESLKLIILHMLRMASVLFPIWADFWTILLKLINPVWKIINILGSYLSNFLVQTLKILINSVKLWFAEMQPAFEYLKPVMEWIGNFISDLKDELQRLWDIAKPILEKLGYQFSEMQTTISGAKEELNEFEKGLNSLDGKVVNTTVNTNYMSSGSSSMSGGGGGMGGGGSGGATTVYAGTGFSYDARTDAYTNVKTGNVIPASDVSSRSDLTSKVKYHDGGIVDGVGDIPALLEAGEMVLTKPMQSKLFGMINNGNISSNGNNGWSLPDIVNALSEAIKNTPLSINNNVNAIFDKRKLSKELIPEFESELKRLGRSL